jgi:multidrug efflux system membrane fusion protein
LLAFIGAVRVASLSCPASEASNIQEHAVSTVDRQADPDQKPAPMRDASPQAAARASRWRGRLLLAGLLAGVAGIGSWYVVLQVRSEPARAAAAVAPVLPPVPVSVAEVARRDFPIYLRGIGAVQAFNAVTIKARVDGELQQVFFREGQDVTAGEVLAQIDPRPFEAQLRQAEAARDRDLALLDTARLDLGRSTELAGRGYAPRQTYDTRKNQVAQLEAAVRADEASIEAVKLQLTYARITSPLAGRTGVRLLDAGNMIHAADPGGIVTITQLQPISVMFSLPQEVLPDVSAAMRAGAPVVVLASTQDGKRQLGSGVLDLIDNTVDQSTGTIRLKAQFPNNDQALWPGQFVNIRLQLSIRQGATVIASTAVQRNQDGTYAWVVKQDGTAAARPIRVERIEGDAALVAGGLEAGESVIIDGQSRLRPGAKVLIRPAPGRAVAEVQTREATP